MKQLSALGARRHAFFRSPRRMRPLVDRLEPGELIPNGPFSFYGGEFAVELRGAAGPGRARWASQEAGWLRKKRCTSSWRRGAAE